MECLHHFCKECIDKSMRLGLPHPFCYSRSLRDYANYDALIAALYPDIDKYEEEELDFHDEEKARNKKIQDSLVETLHRQVEAMGKKRTSSKATSTIYLKRQGNYQNLRARKNQQHKSYEEEGDNDHRMVAKTRLHLMRSTLLKSNQEGIGKGKHSTLLRVQLRKPTEPLWPVLVFSLPNRLFEPRSFYLLQQVDDGGSSLL